jgi:hypothetical protein
MKFDCKVCSQGTFAKISTATKTGTGFTAACFLVKTFNKVILDYAAFAKIFKIRTKTRKILWAIKTLYYPYNIR